MWNRSYRWQRQMRLAAGVGSLVVLAAVGGLLSRTEAARRAGNGARDLARELAANVQERTTVDVPERLGARAGTLIYRDRADGIPQIVGRVARVEAGEAGKARLEIRLTSQLNDASPMRGTLKGAPATTDLRSTMRLLVSPDTPDDEALRARDVIWPTVQAKLLPRMIDALVREVSSELSSLDAQDERLLARSLGELRRELQPLEMELINRLANRTWDTVGVSGVASGIWRATTDQVPLSVDWWWRMLGQDPRPQAAPDERAFLSDELNQALRVALEEEAIAFWREHRAEILAAVNRVILENRPDFEEAFRQRWAGRLYERAIVPSWLDSQNDVLDAVQQYAYDFSMRRLLTREGGPRLLFAYALRSTLDISTDPLLIFAPNDDPAATGVVYRPLLP